VTVKNYKVDLKQDPVVARELLKDGWLIAEEASRVAAGLGLVGRPSKGGAASIGAELVTIDGEPEVRISWAREKFWMYFAETGTVHQNATPFLRTAFNRFR
jgi:hypothetical protein